MRVSAFGRSEESHTSLLGISDSIKKVVLARDVVKPLRDGCDVITMGMFDFLLDEYSLAGIWERGRSW